MLVQSHKYEHAIAGDTPVGKQVNIVCSIHETDKCMEINVINVADNLVEQGWQI